MAMIFKSGYFWAILILSILIVIKLVNPTLIFGQRAFCGESTFAECTINEDCMEGGCSGEICKGKTELPKITDCIWRTCYDEVTFKVNCQCIENQCQWK